MQSVEFFRVKKGSGDQMDVVKQEAQAKGEAVKDGEGEVSADLSASDLDKERLRFEMELEFLECLANPLYLNCTYMRGVALLSNTFPFPSIHLCDGHVYPLALAQQLYFEDEAFVEYLKYLQYWKKPEYAKFIVYPHALYFLDLLQTEEFRKALKNTKFCEDIHLQQFYHWQYYYGKPDEAKVPKQAEETDST